MEITIDTTASRSYRAVIAMQAFHSCSFKIAENNTFSDNPWDEIEDSRPPPTKEELKLYSDITKRVMDKLLELETKTRMM